MRSRDVIADGILAVKVGPRTFEIGEIHITEDLGLRHGRDHQITDIGVNWKRRKPEQIYPVEIAR
jgi:hypothetical protein